MSSSFETWSNALDLPALSSRFGTPLYVTSEAQLQQNLAALSTLVGASENVAFPVKANPSFEVLRTLAKAGASADCASAYEVQLALANGFAPSRILYNSPAPDLALLQQVYASGGTAVADSPRALKHLAPAPAGAAGRLLIRVSLQAPVGHEEDASWKSLVAHATPTGKFGIPQEEIPALLAECAVPVSGLHLHVGTLMDNLSAFETALAALHEMAATWGDQFGHPMNVLNLGGGLGVAFEDGQQFPSREAFVAKLAQALRPGFTYLIEPGNSLVADACALVTKVVDTKLMRGKKWAICDVGSDQLLRATLIAWRSRILHQGQPLPRTGPDSVAGPLCFAGDVLLPETDLSAVEPEDLLLIQHTGAYGYAVSNHFNGRLGPAHVLLREGQKPVLAMAAEDDFFEQSSLASLPLGLQDDSPREVVSLERVNALSSVYLREQAGEDTYQVLGLEKQGSQYTYKVAAFSPLGVVSLPFALRILSDLGIVSVLDAAGKQAKDGSVWGTRIAMSADKMVPTKSPVTLQVWVKARRTLPAEQPSYDVHFRFNGGAFAGSARAVF